MNDIKYIGIDVHQATSVFAVINQQGKLQGEARDIASSNSSSETRASEALKALLALFSQYLPSSRLSATAVYPRTGYSPGSWNLLPLTADNAHGQ
jgi:hypothetical protein